MKIFPALYVLFFVISQQASAQLINRNDVVIDEIMADPSPPVGLPANEWIELKNISSLAINLSGWRLMKDAGQSGPMPNYILKPDSFVIVCTGSAAATMSLFGPAISVTSFPSLGNDGDLIYLRSADNKIINAVNYNSGWYRNELKKEGGWTLEMTDTKNPCGGSGNWSASDDSKGGTPAKINSIDAANSDEIAPKLLRAVAIDSITLSLIFDESLDSLKAMSAQAYTVSDGIGKALAATVISPLFDKVMLTISSPLLKNKIYSITVNDIADCAGNNIGSQNISRVGLSSVADSFDVVINEILFNPSADGVDYVELYNRSLKIIDLKQLYIANRNATGAISSIQQLSTESSLFFPGEFLVVTEDVAAVLKKYITANANAFLQVAAMPSYPDDKGDVIILNANGNITDELLYDDKWHFELISNTEGVALERIDYNGASVKNNFHSAATSVGYGTPGYKNSQYHINDQLQGEVIVSPAIFSPDNDGMDDFAIINYHFPEPGFVANITIFDVSGRPVRFLQRSALCGIKGNFIWDGLNEKHQALPQGIYIFFTEIFNGKAIRKQFKNTIVLARRE